jgi:hypothetical protein
VIDVEIPVDLATGKRGKMVTETAARNDNGAETLAKREAQKRRFDILMDEREGEKSVIHWLV